jgi:hypothetical protein
MNPKLLMLDVVCHLPLCGPFSLRSPFTSLLFHFCCPAFLSRVSSITLISILNVLCCVPSPF